MSEGVNTLKPADMEMGTIVSVERGESPEVTPEQFRNTVGRFHQAILPISGEYPFVITSSTAVALYESGGALDEYVGDLDMMTSPSGFEALVNLLQENTESMGVTGFEVSYGADATMTQDEHLPGVKHLSCWVALDGPSVELDVWVNIGVGVVREHAHSTEKTHLDVGPENFNRMNLTFTDAQKQECEVGMKVLDKNSLIRFYRNVIGIEKKLEGRGGREAKSESLRLQQMEKAYKA